MSPEKLCRKCGAPVSDEVAGGFCTACLLEEGILLSEFEQSPITLRHFGDYELIEEIARGGMGVVFKARQRSLNRIVAVKMILSGHLASEAQVQRFRAEARAAAALQHPGIVAIHEIGEHEGLLFFSMDYVPGQNLAQQVRDGPWPATRAAQCVRDIAEAIQYAHEQGVLHRDLKPSNVLIDANGKPHVTDFGLAKQLNPDSQPSTHDDQLTLSGQVLGSPNFMPPEQAAGKHHELTPAADIYSLGAILYHCLTGRPPFVAETLTQTLRMVAEQEPVSPRLLNASVPRDLETICLKCLEKDPSRRYPSAQALADDLNHFLRNEPIHARPVGLVLKVHRWCLRNKALAISGTAILALLLVVAIGSPIAAIRINRERKQAEANEQKARMEAAKSRQVSQFLQDMLKGVGPSVALGRDTTLLREILDQTAERLSRDLTNQPSVEIELRETIGRVYLELGDYRKAEAMQRRAVELRRKLSAGNQLQLAKSLSRLSGVLENLGNYADAENLAREALSIQTNLLGTDHIDVAWTLNSLAVQLSGQGKNDEAEALFQQVLELRRKLLGPDHRDVANTLGNLASLKMDRDPVEAERMLREELAMLHRLYGEEHPDMDVSLDNLAMVLALQKKYEEAEKTARAALPMKRKLLGAVHPHVSRTVGILGWILQSQGKLADAERFSREDFEIKEKTVGYQHPETRIAVNGLLSIMRESGRLNEAETFLRELESKVLRSTEVSTPGVSNLLATTTRARIEILFQTGKSEDAGRLARAHLATLGTNDLAAADLLITLADGSVSKKEFVEAETFLRRAFQIQQRLAGTNLSLLVGTLGRLCGLLDQAQKYSAAEQLLQQRLTMLREVSGSTSREVAGDIGWLAAVLSKERKYAQAEPLLREKLAIEKQIFGLEHTNSLGTTEWLANNLADQKEWSRCELTRKDLVSGRRKVFGDTHPETLRALTELHYALVQQGKQAEAESVARELAAAQPWDQAPVYGRAGKWKEAAAGLAKALEAEPGNHFPYHLLAPLLVASGDAEGYRRICESIQVQFGGTQDPLVCERMVKACLILPGAKVDFEKINRWVKTALTAEHNSSLFRYAQFASGLAAYRQSDHARALESAQTVLSLPGTDPHPEVAAWTVIAMANHALNQSNDAVAALSKARELAAAKLPKLEAGDLGTGWNDWIITQALLREAGALVEGTSPDADDFSLKR